MDNRPGILLTSMCQAYDDGDDLDSDVWSPYFNAVANAWRKQYLAFVYAIKVTGMPQFVSIRGPGGGHAMVVYKAGGDTLRVSDPNKPGDRTSHIAFKPADGTFVPYIVGLNAAAPTSQFPRIYFMARSANVNEQTMAGYWADMQAGAIGAGCFPSYTLTVLDGSGYPLGDSLNTDAESLVVAMECPTCAKKDPGDYGFTVYDTTGAVVATSGPGFSAVIHLEPGRNELGFHVQAAPAADCGGAAVDCGPEWLDFRWIPVTRIAFSVASKRDDGVPFAVPGGVDSLYTFVARSPTPLPGDAKYVWYWDDGSDNDTITGDSTATHAWSETGPFWVYVLVYDGETGNLLGEAWQDAQIHDPGIWDLYHATTAFNIGISADNTYSDGHFEQGEYWVVSNHVTGDTYAPIAWTDSSFAFSFTNVTPVGENGSDSVSCAVTCSLSLDGTTIRALHVRRTRHTITYAVSGNLYSDELDILDFTVREFIGMRYDRTALPLFSEMAEDDLAAGVTVNRHDYHYVYYPDDPDEVIDRSYVSTDWTAASAIMQVAFYTIP